MMRDFSIIFIILLSTFIVVNIYLESVGLTFSLSTYDYSL